MWYSGKPRLWKENNCPYIPICNMVGMVLIIATSMAESGAYGNNIYGGT